MASSVAAALSALTGVAFAGTLSPGSVNTYAAEALGNATSVQVANVSYSLTNNIAPATTGTFTYALDTLVSTATTPSAANCPSVAPNAAIAGFVIGAATISKDGKTCSYPFTVAAVPVPNNTILSFTGAKTDGVAALASSGKVNATVGVLDSTGAAVSGEGGTVTVAFAANALALTFTPSSNFTTSNANTSKTEQSRLNLTVSPSASAFTNPDDVTGTSTTVINVGALKLALTQGYLGPDAGAFNFSTISSEQFTVNVGGPFVDGAAVSVNTAADCTGTVLGTATIAGGKSTAKFTWDPGLTSSSATSSFAYVCYTAPTTAKTMNPGQFSGSADFDATYTPTTTKLTTTSVGSTNLYNLTYNGSQITVRNYTPAGTGGWTSSYRIINTGSVPATVTGQFIGADGKAATTSVAITGSIPAGGAVALTAAEIEAILGAPPAGVANPRLRLSAQTESMRVQTLAVQPNGNVFVNSDAQSADGGTSSQ